MNMNEYEYEIEYEPTRADEIFKVASDALMDALNDDVAQRIKSLNSKVEYLSRQNERLRKEITEMKAKEAEISRREKEIDRKAKRMSVKEFFGQREVILYRAALKKDSKAPKCDRCNDDRIIEFQSPLGVSMTEQCECSQWKYSWQPEELIVYELRKNGQDLFMWFKPYNDDDGDGFYRGKIVRPTDVYVDGMWFNDLNKAEIRFRELSECQFYCNWLNNLGGG